MGKLDRRRLCPGVPGSSSGCVSSGSLGRGRGCHQSSRCEQVLLGSQPSTAITPPPPLQFGTLQVFVTLCSGFSSIPFVRKAKVSQEPGLLFYPPGYTAPTQEKTPAFGHQPGENSGCPVHGSGLLLFLLLQNLECKLAH